MTEPLPAQAPSRTVWRRLRSPIFWSILAAGAAYALWLAWRDASVAELPSELHPAALGLSVALRLAATLLTVAVWLGLYRGLGGVVGTRDGFRIYLLTNLGKYLPGKVMHAAGRVALLRERGQPATVGVTSIVLELLISLLAAAIVSILSIPLLLSSQGMGQYAAVVAVVAVLSVPVGLVALHPRVIGPVLRVGARWMPGGGGPLSTRLPSYRSILVLLAAYTVVWILGSLGLFAAARSIYPLDASWLPAMGGIVAISYVAGVLVPFAPAGIGAREGLMTLLLSTIMPAPAAAVVSVLYRLMSILAELIGAGLTVAVGMVLRPELPAALAPPSPLHSPLSARGRGSVS